MGKLGTAFLCVAALAGCDLTQAPQSATSESSAGTPLPISAFINRPAGAPLRNCCLCLTDGAFASNNRYCSQTFNAKYAASCDATIVGPRLHFQETGGFGPDGATGEASQNAIADEDARAQELLVEERNAENRRLFNERYLGALRAKAAGKHPQSMCEGLLYVSVHGHSGPMTFAEEVSPIAKVCVANGIAPKKIAGEVTGCQGNMAPDDIGAVLKELQAATGAEFVSSGGNQCFDPGDAGKDWTYCKVSLTKKSGAQDPVTEVQYSPCHAAGANCTLGAYGGVHIEYGMGARCTVTQKVQAQFCCPADTLASRFAWTKPVDLEFGSIPSSPCPDPRWESAADLPAEVDQFGDGG